LPDNPGLAAAVDGKADESKLTGKATLDNGANEIQDGKIEGDTVTLVENLMYQGPTLRIEYTGKVSGYEIRFTRKVADFDTEDLVANRAREGASQS
jgi:hypothetical protein